MCKKYEFAILEWENDPAVRYNEEFTNPLYDWYDMRSDFNEE